ncbi:dihydrofolate reductase family protein [Stackebrandtia nassauensis]|uniref:Bifunctional deaminase-reductase domain protein n=1 Tax=Stackebrandtia nassauensis (strain DSM 44728 / CIP 108903 / NRRL B-16338 / NBRC 102104 / LLR-40K-21) TaxID=446470 RepID=D3PXM1_STANL|nr:dihydrofolate reductase family protein [Stackebrandtia nassauensis]ADD43351.1 bifunctional deaminase-reductase domain protein [Stackebrandtia nassauensis DSM 44728]
MKLVVQEFLTLDGVSQGPGAPDEDPSGGFTRGGWFVPYLDDEFEGLVTSWLGEADALLFGRRTYDNFARDWPAMNDHPNAATMNGLPKFVATRGSVAGAWEPTTVLAGDVAAQVAELKARPGRELQVHGSAELAQSLLGAGLVDTLRLVIAPCVVGQGRRLFPDGGAAAGLRPVSQRMTPGGLSVQVFDTAGELRRGTYGA